MPEAQLLPWPPLGQQTLIHACPHQTVQVQFSAHDCSFSILPIKGGLDFSSRKQTLVSCSWRPPTCISRGHKRSTLKSSVIMPHSSTLGWSNGLLGLIMPQMGSEMGPVSGRQSPSPLAVLLGPPHSPSLRCSEDEPEISLLP